MADDAALWNRVSAVKFAEPLSIEDARTVLFRCNSFSRLSRLIDMWSSLEVEADDWLRLLGEFWSICDNIGPLTDELLDETPFADAVNDPKRRPLLMDEEECAALDALPDDLVLYRGCYASNKWGLSWSVDRDIAAKFPVLHRYRQEGQPLLVTAKALKADVVALKLDRNEKEIIALRGRISGSKPQRNRLRHVSTSHLVESFC